jgi:hypothetical protein
MKGDIMNLDFGNRPVAIKALVGSWASNLQTENSDMDWKYFVSPTFDDLYSGKMFSSANQSDTLDYDCHDIRQLGNLIWKSNISFIITLFSPTYECNPALQWIFDRGEEFASMNLPYLYNATMGMHYEKMKTLLNGTAKTDVLVAQFGYDTKQACHAVRCLYILERIASGKSMREAFWFDGADRQSLLDIKAGAFTVDELKKGVEGWHSFKKGWVSEWFSKQTAHEELSVELNQGIKTYIRINL